MIVWLAEGALLSAIVDEVDMGFSCLLKWQNTPSSRAKM
jgi:hypothetical protein